MPAQLLVTGAGGQLGRAMARLRPDAALLRREDLDVADPGAVQRALVDARPDVVLHAAAYTRVDAAERDPDGAAAVNEGGARAVAAAAAGVGALLVYPSTDYVFGGDSDRPYRESDLAGPLSVYGRTKLAGERAADACPRHLIVRTSWVFGEGRNFVRAILTTARRREELCAVDDQIGAPTSADDLAAGILRLIDAGATGLFHLRGGGEPASWADVADAALDGAVRRGLIARRPRVRRTSTAEYNAARDEPAAPRPAYGVLDCSRAASLGVRLRPWREALEDYLDGEARRRT